MRHAAGLLLIALLISSACRRSPSYFAVPISSLPGSLAPLDGAKGVTAHVQQDTTVHVRYVLVASYPAEGVVHTLANRLSSLGYVPQESLSVESPLLSTPPSEWRSFGLSGPPRVAHQLVLAWRDNRSTVVAYELRYISPVSRLAEPWPVAPASGELELDGVFLPAPAAQAWARSVRATPPVPAH